MHTLYNCSQGEKQNTKRHDNATAKIPWSPAMRHGVFWRILASGLMVQTSLPTPSCRPIGRHLLKVHVAGILPERILAAQTFSWPKHMRKMRCIVAGGSLVWTTSGVTHAITPDIFTDPLFL